MDLRHWIIDEHASVLDRFEQSVASRVPIELWTSPAGDGGSSIAWLLYHTSLHEDLAVNAVLCGDRPLIDRFRPALGLMSITTATGLGETEQPDLTKALELEVLAAYALEVHRGTQAWLTGMNNGELGELFDRADADGPGALARSGIAENDVPWLYRMWSQQPAIFFLQWEAIGHRVNHVGEMVSVRNRLGLSPF